MAISGKFDARRKNNAAAFAAFGVAIDETSPDTIYKAVRDGQGPTVYTIGYEGRDSEDLICRLRDAGVDLLLDIRERPFSRKPDFRKSALEAACDESGIGYESWVQLGSTGPQREKLKETGNIGEFMRRFRDFARRGRSSDLDDLAKVVCSHTVALLCYERDHCECHRSVVADLVADRIDATIIAIT